MRTILIGLGLLITFGSPMVAQTNSCFSWFCNGKECSFDASCSSGEPFIWKYFWDFGDGTTATVGGSSINHTYPAEPANISAEVTLRVITYSTFVDETCLVNAWTFFPVGPRPPNFGTCD